MSIQFRTRNSNIQPTGLTGACCIPAGDVAGCQEAITYTECTNMGGIFQGINTACTDVNCSEQRSMFVLGACCACNGSCTDEVTEDWCNSRQLDPTTPRASFHIGKKCTDVECPSVTTFDCCAGGVVFAGICNGDLCREVGGQTADFGQGCDNSNLVAYSGACCNITVAGYNRPCHYMDIQDKQWHGNPEGMCISLGGTFYQEETCSDGFCAEPSTSMHACCRHDGCFSLSEEICTNSNGLYMGEIGCANTNCENIEWGACVTDTICLQTDTNTCHEYSGEWFSGYACDSTSLSGSFNNSKSGKMCRVFGEPQCVDNITEAQALEIITTDYNDTEWVFVEGGNCDECQESYSCYDADDEVGMCIYSHASDQISTNPRNRSAFSTTRKWCRKLGGEWSPSTPLSSLFKGCGTDASHLSLLTSLPYGSPDLFMDGYPFNYYGSPEDGYALGSCSIDGVCNNNMNQSNCQTQGGIYMGNGTHCNHPEISTGGASGGSGGASNDPSYTNYTTWITRKTFGQFIEFVSSSYEDDVAMLPSFYYRTNFGIHPPMLFPNDNLALSQPTHTEAVRSIHGEKLRVKSSADLSSIKTLSFIKSDANGRYSPLDIHGVNFTLLGGIQKLEIMPDQDLIIESVSNNIKELNLQGSRKVIDVTVLPKPISGNQYVVDGVARDTLFLYRGHTYRFNMSHESLAPATSFEDHHPLRFSEIIGGHHNGGTPFIQGVVIYKNTGENGAYIDITIDDNTPETLYYHCMNHAGMGGEIEVRNHFVNKSLDLSSKTSIKKLFMNDVNLENITLPSSDTLNILHCSGNNISSVDITGHPYIYGLDVSYNQLSSIDLSEFGSFDGHGTIDVSNNNITLLDLPVFYGGTRLQYLDASDNPLVIANIQDNTKIDVIDLSHTNLSNLSMPSGTEVKELYLNNSGLSSISMNNTIDITLESCRIIDASNNTLTDIPFIAEGFIPKNIEYLNMANNSLNGLTITNLFSILANSHSTHEARKLVINIKNNTGTIDQQEINTLREIWGSKLTIIHD